MARVPKWQQLGFSEKVKNAKGHVIGYRTPSGAYTSERQYRELTGKSIRTQAERRQGAPVIRDADFDRAYTGGKRTLGAKSKPARPLSKLGNKQERRYIPDDAARWTKRQREIVRNYIKAHPYDATLDGLRGKKPPTPYDSAEERTLQNLETKLDVLKLKRDAGVITKREYERQRKAVEYIANNINRVFNTNEGSPEHKKALADIAKRYEILRDSTAPEKRLVMSKDETKKYLEELDTLDIYHEIYYH